MATPLLPAPLIRSGLLLYVICARLIQMTVCHFYEYFVYSRQMICINDWLCGFYLLEVLNIGQRLEICVLGPNHRTELFCR